MCGFHEFHDLHQGVGRRGPALNAHHDVGVLRGGVQRQPSCDKLVKYIQSIRYREKINKDQWRAGNNDDRGGAWYRVQDQFAVVWWLAEAEAGRVRQYF